jgi:hypothetical protein
MDVFCEFVIPDFARYVTMYTYIVICMKQSLWTKNHSWNHRFPQQDLNSGGCQQISLHVHHAFMHTTYVNVFLYIISGICGLSHMRLDKCVLSEDVHRKWTVKSWGIEFACREIGHSTIASEGRASKQVFPLPWNKANRFHVSFGPLQNLLE